MSGELLFHAQATLRVPASVTVDDVRTMLEALAAEMMVDVSVDDV
jgi:glycine cleavage system regulatory protein